MLVQAVDKALHEKRTLSPGLITRKCKNFDQLLDYLPKLFTNVDEYLFDGAMQRFLSASDIQFTIVKATDGPVGLTTYESRPHQMMKIHIRSDAWPTNFPALVGGELCSRADTCLINIFLHEMLHVVLFCIYLELDLQQHEIDDMIHSNYDPTHNVLFTVWLRQFFGQHTINNSLLLKSDDSKNPLVFKRNILDTEKSCVYNPQKKITLFHKGKHIPVEIIDTFSSQTNTTLHEHHSRVRTKDGHILIVPNGLLSC